MILKRHLNWAIIFSMGWRQIVYFALLATAVYVGYEFGGITELSIHFVPIGEIGTALAIFLAFRNNSAYDRWWEARKIWGELVNLSRAFAGQTLTFLNMQVSPEAETDSEMTAFKKELVYRHIGFVHSLRLHLRNQSSYSDVKPFIPEGEFEKLMAADNKPNLLIQIQREKIAEAFRNGWLEVFRQVEMDRTLTDFNHIQGKCERIKNTPFPRPYDYFTRLLVYFYATLLPFGLVEELEIFTIPVSLSISTVFFILDQVGANTEDPFENLPNDIPLSSLSRTIEINLREQLGEKKFPPKVQAIKGFLH